MNKKLNYRTLNYHVLSLLRDLKLKSNRRVSNIEVTVSPSNETRLYYRVSYSDDPEPSCGIVDYVGKIITEVEPIV